jgi:hypothetical protein
MTAAITWAVLATVGAVAVYWLMRAECRELDRAGYECWTRALDAELELEAIRVKRHLSAKHARAAQLAAKRLQVVGKAAEINREMGR